MKTYRYTSHESFDHDSIESLGFDWERVANPGIAPKFPVKIYLPRTTEHVVAAIREVSELGQRLRVRSKGHSSNDLVLEADGVVLCTEKLNRIIHLDENAGTVRIQSGAVLADVDEKLAESQLGLPIIGDHNHITAGGFASVGGISPASHRFGLFVDNVLEIEYVDWQGRVSRCSREQRPEQFYKVLTGTGRYGVMTELTCRVQRINKLKTIVRNRRRLFREREEFVIETQRLIAEPGNCLFERGVWVDYPLGMFKLRVGQFSVYNSTSQNYYTRLRRNIAYGYLHTLGYWAGRLPSWLDIPVKFLGMLGIILSPRYGLIKDIESFTDKVLDSSVGDPTRMLIVLAPVESYSDLFRRMHEYCEEVRDKYGAITFISFYVKAIWSKYLAANRGSGRYAELMLYLGINPEKMTSEILDELVTKIDDLCIKYQGLRYMHSKSSKDPVRLARIDPNYLYPDASP